MLTITKVSRLPFLLFFSILCLQASALSSPANLCDAPMFEDSTVKIVSVAPSRFALRQKPAFLARLGEKLLGFFVSNAAKSPAKASTKSILGWIALSATGLGIILLFAGSVGAITGWLLLGGILTGIVALCLPKSKEDRAAKKKSNTAAIIALVLGGGLIIALIAALSSSIE